jgi:hypothetical protein
MEDTAEQSTPPMLYNGQLYSREMAAAELVKA